MRYTIFSVDNSRQHYIDKMRYQLRNEEYVETEVVDGRDPEQLKRAMKKHPYEINYDAKVGHLGIWYTVLNAMEHAPIVTFEDDAILNDDFMTHFGWRIAELPGDTDFFSLFLPRDSDHLYTPNKARGNFICETYQRYGGVSMLHTMHGRDMIKELLKRDGITGQYDDTLYMYAKKGELKGYCSQPRHQDLVYITGMEQSIVQETESYR